MPYDAAGLWDGRAPGGPGPEGAVVSPRMMTERRRAGDPWVWESATIGMLERCMHRAGC